ncbi:hypothetical protein [Sphingomonas sp. NIC1]|uniref:hypothetical protein n=1 Tax=Sphingomonas sp. NIC1 TaxID=1961362 RepID=UPI0007C0DE6D|nr:hypothetical protein [Sphingomonas sp. NIC1]ANC85482.1 hypothetical protein A7E77_00345 [Sphingomonas sp. NIC1]
MSVEELRELADRLRKGRLVQQSRMMISAINGLPVEMSAGEVREHAHPDAIAAADAIEWLLSDRHQAEEAMRERISMLEKLLSDCADELAAEVEARFERVWGHPGMRHKIERDMNTVVAARAAIRSIDTRGE